MFKQIYVSGWGFFVKATTITRTDGTTFISNTFSNNENLAKNFNEDDIFQNEVNRLKKEGYRVSIMNNPQIHWNAN